MFRKIANVFAALIWVLPATTLAASGLDEPELVKYTIEQQHSVVQPGGSSAFAIHFQLVKGWHFYASPQTAPGEMNLKITPSDDKFIHFGQPILPQAQSYFDKSSEKKLDVFSDKFTVYLPFKVEQSGSGIAAVKIKITGAVCSDIQCRVPRFADIDAQVKISPDANMGKAAFSLAMPSTTAGQGAGFSIWLALVTAFAAGMAINIMPCVWPVLPIIVMRIVQQGRQGRSRSITMGLAFCAGILLFFACLAAANIVLQLFYGTVLQWGDQFRNPVFVGVMSMLLVVLAMFMFGLFTVNVPASMLKTSDKSGGLAGAVGMGFLAAILSTPCSFGILAAAFAWAQAQTLVISTIAIMVIGLGMAIPYAVLTAIPGLVNRLPRAGRWMELFKQTIGFVLLIIAVKLIGALPEKWMISTLYFSVILSFAVWMWGTWVSYDTPAIKKWMIRLIAVILAAGSGFALFHTSAAEKLINWQAYDASVVENASAVGRPVLLKFTAGWCLSCQAAEKAVYSREDVARLMKEKGVLAIKADTTESDFAATRALKNVYNEPGVPVSILLLPDGSQIRWHGIFFADELKKALEKLPAGSYDKSR